MIWADIIIIQPFLAISDLPHISSGMILVLGVTHVIGAQS